MLFFRVNLLHPHQELKSILHLWNLSMPCNCFDQYNRVEVMLCWKGTSIEKFSELIKDLRKVAGYKVTIRILVVFQKKNLESIMKRSIYSQYTEKYKTCRNKIQMSRIVFVRVSAGNRWYVQISVTRSGFNKVTIYNGRG